MEEFNRNELKNKTLEQFRPAPARPVAPAPQHVEDIDDGEEEETFFEKFKLIVPMIIIAIVSFIAYAWYTDKFAISKNSADLPIIKANKDPLREKPEDPGGMKIINRDKRVFDAISGKDNDKDPKAANILPAPEEPIAHDEVVKNESSAPELINKLPEQEDSGADANATLPKAEINTTTKAAPLPSTTENNTKVADAPAAPIVAPVTAIKAEPAAGAAVKEQATEATPATKATEEKPKEKVKAVTADDITDVAPAKKAAPQKKATKVDPGYRVQLGSYRSSGDAESSWKTIKKKFPDILGGLNEYIEKADLGDKGIFYRLQLSGFKNESDARKSCQKLTEKKQGCFFVGK